LEDHGKVMKKRKKVGRYLGNKLKKLIKIYLSTKSKCQKLFG